MHWRRDRSRPTSGRWRAAPIADRPYAAAARSGCHIRSPEGVFMDDPKTPSILRPDPAADARLDAEAMA